MPVSYALRFWSHVDKSGECWEWTAARQPSGYGKMVVGSRLDGSRRFPPSHRLAWELTHGPIPQGLHVLHHCDNPPCCNPAHRFLGTDADNAADKVAKGRQATGVKTYGGRKTHCPAGHAYTHENVRAANGRRHCRLCARRHTAEWRARRKVVIPIPCRARSPNTS